MNHQFEAFRRNFPAYSEGVYANHAAVSPMGMDTREMLLESWMSRAHLPVDVYPEIVDDLTAWRDGVANLIGAQAPESIAMTLNTSHGLNLVASGMAWRPGDRVLLGRMEFPACVYPFMNLQRLGVELDWLDPADGRITPERVAAALRPETRLVAVSYVQFLSGFRADLAAIGRVCREKGVRLVVDGIQGVGVAPMAVEEWGVDALACGGHKWLMWPMGTAFLYLSPSFLEELTPAHAGWLSVKDAWELLDYRLDFRDGAGRFELGTCNWLGLRLANRRLASFHELGLGPIADRVRELTGRLMAGLSDQGWAVITPGEDSHRAGIVSVRTDNGKAILSRLQETGIVAAVRADVVRFSLHCANSDRDVARIVAAMADFR